MTSFDFWKKWLLVAAWISIIFGASMALLGRTVVFDFMNTQIDPVFWKAGGPDPATLRNSAYMFGAMGSIMVGWGITNVFLVRNAFRNREAWAWRSLLVSLIFWYVLATGLSAYYAVVFDVVLNTVFFLMFLIPLLMTRRYLINEVRG